MNECLNRAQSRGADGEERDDATLFQRGGGARGATTPRKSAASPELKAIGVATPPSGTTPRKTDCALAGPPEPPTTRAAGKGRSPPSRDVSRSEGSFEASSKWSP